MTPDFQKCSRKENCQNNGIIIFDTNFIIYMIEAICGKVENELDSASRNDKFNSFFGKLNSILEGIKPCAQDGTFWTSDLVYNGEIDPTNRLSTLRREGDRFNTMCGRLNRNYAKINQMLNKHIRVVDTNRDDIMMIKTLFSDNPDDEDISLVSASTQKSMNQLNTLLLTDDHVLGKRIEKIVKLKTLKLNGTEYPTRKIYPTNFLNFLERVHDCCNLSSYLFGDCMAHKYLVEDIRPNRFLKAKKIKQGEMVWYRFTDSVVKKMERQASV